MADNKIQLVISALDQTQSAFASLQQSLKQANDEFSSFSKNASEGSDSLSSSLMSLKSSITAVAAALGAWKIADFVKDATLLAARVETLGVVLGVVGNNAGYSKTQMEQYSQGVAAMGITTEESRQTVIRMAQANLDLGKSAQLARVAQDAAVIANINSSDVLQGIMHGITTLQPEVLRTYGIMVNFEMEYKKVALASGRTVEMLTAHEKQQIAMNLVLDKGSAIAGSYEAAMGTAGKQLMSVKRYMDELKLSIGNVFTPVLSVAVTEFTGSLKDMGKWFKDNPSTVKDWAASVVHSFFSARAELMRLAMLTDKIGGSLTAAGMLLFGPGAALGNANSKKQFEMLAAANMDFEARYNEKDTQLQKLADDEQKIINKIYAPSGSTATSAAEQAKIDKAIRDKAQRDKEEQELIMRERNAKIGRETADAALREKMASIKGANGIAAEATKLEEAKLEESYKKRLITEEEYYAQKQALQENQLRADIDMLKAEEKATADAWEKKSKNFLPGKDDAEKIKEAAQVKAEIIKLQAEQTKKETDIEILRSKSRGDSSDRDYRNEKARLEMSLKTAETQARLEKERLSLSVQSGDISETDSKRQALDIDLSLLDTKQQIAERERDIAKTGDERAKAEEKIKGILEEREVLAIKINELMATRDGLSGMKRALQSYADATSNMGAQIENAFTNAFKGMEDALVKFVQTGKLDFKDMANSIISDLIRIQIRASITGPLASGLNSAISGMFSGGTIDNYNPNTTYAGSSPGPWAPPAFHSGGKVVPRFHFGGLASDEVPAILQTGERVLDREHNKLLEKFANKTGDTSSAPIINITNNVSDKTETKVAPHFDGQQWVVDMVIDKLRSDPGTRAAFAGGGNF